MEEGLGEKNPSSLRWGILRDAFLSRNRSSQPVSADEKAFKMGISRRTSRGGFNLIPCQPVIPREEEEEEEKSIAAAAVGDDGDKDIYISYTLPLAGAPKLILRQRRENTIHLNDFHICNKYDIDNTGLVCRWPSEEVLAYFCLSHAYMFRSKRILELGAGYGLAGLVIAASTDALEVVISDGNPQVVDYIQHSIDANSGAFTETTVKSMILHWNQVDVSNMLNAFDIIVASDCTFFKEFHEGLARTVKSLLKHSEGSEAIFLCPKRGNSLDKFIEKIREFGLQVGITQNYDKEVWLRHQIFLNGDESWPNYEVEHCYPLLIRITP